MRIDLREPKKEFQMVVTGFRRQMEELGKGVSVIAWLKRQIKQWSNDKDIFERAKERIANGDDRLSAVNEGVKNGNLGGRYLETTEQKRRSNDKDRFERAKERIANDDDRL